MEIVRISPVFILRSVHRRGLHLVLYYVYNYFITVCDVNGFAFSKPEKTGWVDGWVGGRPAGRQPLNRFDRCQTQAGGRAKSGKQLFTRLVDGVRPQCITFHAPVIRRSKRLVSVVCCGWGVGAGGGGSGREGGLNVADCTDFPWLMRLAS
jgi:hypothetical protein